MYGKLLPPPPGCINRFRKSDLVVTKKLTILFDEISIQTFETREKWIPFVSGLINMSFSCSECKLWAFCLGFPLGAKAPLGSWKLLFTKLSLYCRRWSKACMLLTCILGLTWLFGVFYINQESLFMAYFFTIFNTLQVRHGSTSNARTYRAAITLATRLEFTNVNFFDDVIRRNNWFL